jgi:hypothetical protein
VSGRSQPHAAKMGPRTKRAKSARLCAGVAVSRKMARVDWRRIRAVAITRQTRCWRRIALRKRRGRFFHCQRKVPCA